MSWFRVWLDPGVQRDCRVLCLCLPPPSPLTSALASRPHDLPVQTGSFLEPCDLRPEEAKLRLPSAQPNQLAPAHEDPGKALPGQPRGSCGGLGHSGWPGLGRGPPCAQSEALSPCGSSGAHQNHSDRVQRADPPKSEGSGCPHQKRERDAGQTETRGIATLPHGAVGNPKWQRAYEHALSP